MAALTWVAYRVGYMFRETGQALERLGCRMQGSNAYLEVCERHPTLRLNAALDVCDLSHSACIYVTHSTNTPHVSQKRELWAVLQCGGTAL